MQIEIERLKPHPKNSYYFDELPPAEFEDLKRSIETSGCIEQPLVIYDREALYSDGDLIILSGTQRIKAMKELGYKYVSVEFANVLPNDKQGIIKRLIESNLRRRGGAGMKKNSLKFGRCASALMEIYGIRQGSAGKVAKRDNLDGQNVAPKTQAELAAKMGTSTKQMQRARSLEKLIPEFQDALEKKRFSNTLADKIAKLDPKRQRELFLEVKDKEKIIPFDVDTFINYKKEQDANANKQRFLDEYFDTAEQECRLHTDPEYLVWKLCDKLILQLQNWVYESDKSNGYADSIDLNDVYTVIKDHQEKVNILTEMIENKLDTSPQDK